jgi:hypothetical protein
MKSIAKAGLGVIGVARPGDSLAQLYLSTPRVEVNPQSWSKDVFSAATAYPNPGAPANIKNSTLPVSTSTATDFSIADYLTEFPNTINQAGYTNLYEFRLYTSSPTQLAGVSAPRGRRRGGAAHRPGWSSPRWCSRHCGARPRARCNCFRI